MYQRPPTMVIASAVMLHPNYPFLVSSFDSESESENQFDFSISRELLLNPNDVLVGEMIGEGSNSVVYRGIYQRHVPVAVKIVQPSKTAAVSIEQKEKFEKEVMMLSNVKHDNIVKFVGACIEPQLVIVTELLEGGTLRKFMWDSRPRQIDLKTSLNFALDIARAMEFLHSNGIIHRDLEPRNIMITGNLKKVKVVNFGLAREETTGGMTCEAGTYRYMAPEAFSIEPLKHGEKKHYDHKVDVYSFALVFWELLMNETAFEKFNHMSVPYYASKNCRPSLDHVPSEFESILESCWAQDSNTRPEFKEIIVLLTNLLSSLGSDSSSVMTLSDRQFNLDVSVMTPSDRQFYLDESVMTLSDQQFDIDEINDSEIVSLIQDFHHQVTKHEDGEKEIKKKSKKKKNKVRMIILRFMKMFEACLYKP